MNDYPIILRLLEYYRSYFPWLIIAISLNTLFLVYINKKLNKTGFASDEIKHDGLLKSQLIGPMLFMLTVAFLFSINLGLDEFDSMEGVNAMIAKWIISKHSLWFINFMLMFAHQPLYPLILNLLIRLSGWEHFGVLLRSVSVFWGVLVVYLTYRFSAKIINNKLIVYFTAAFLCAHSLFYFYARRGEGYSFFCFFALLSCYYFWDVFIRGKTSKLWKYIIVNIFCFFIHYLTLFIILSQLIAMVLLKWHRYTLPVKSMTRFIKALIIFCFTVILSAPGIWLSILNNEFLFENNWQNNFYLGKGYFLTIVNNVIRLVLGTPQGTPFIYLYLLIFIIIISKIRKYNLPFFTLVIGIFLSGIFYEATFLFTPWKAIGKFYPNFRHLVWMAPFTAMVYGYGVYMLSKQTKFRKFAGCSILAIPLLWNIHQSYDICFKPQTPAYTKVANFIKTKCQKDDFIGRPVSWIDPFVYGEQKYPYNVKRGEINTDNFPEIKSKYKRVWALMAHEDYFGVPHYNPESINNWFKLLNQDLSLVKTWHAYKMDVYLFTTTHD